MDEAIIDIYRGDVALMSLCPDLMPDHISDGGGYPKSAYSLSGDTERCAGGIGSYTHDLMFIVESKGKDTAVAIKNRIVEVYEAHNSISYLGYSDEYENTTKTYLVVINFKINKNEL